MADKADIVVAGGSRIALPLFLNTIWIGNKHVRVPVLARELRETLLHRTSLRPSMEREDERSEFVDVDGGRNVENIGAKSPVGKSDVEIVAQAHSTLGKSVCNSIATPRTLECKCGADKQEGGGKNRGKRGQHDVVMKEAVLTNVRVVFNERVLGDTKRVVTDCL